MHLAFKRLTQADTFFNLRTVAIPQLDVSLLICFQGHIWTGCSQSISQRFVFTASTTYFLKTGNELYILPAQINCWSSPSGGWWPTLRFLHYQREPHIQIPLQSNSLFPHKTWHYSQGSRLFPLCSKSSINYLNHFHRRAQKKRNKKKTACGSLTLQSAGLDTVYSTKSTYPNFPFAPWINTHHGIT